MRLVRDTRQRRAIRDALVSAGRPLSPDEVLAVAQRSVSGLGIATVYRTLKTLMAEGSVEAVELPGQIAHYEMAGKGHHHHFHCKGCDQIFEVSGCLDGFRTLIPKGFQVTGHEFVLYGYCRPCRAEARG
jgi:Fur family transcriptional regulator, ferric uptake regulator